MVDSHNVEKLFCCQLDLYKKSSDFGEIGNSTKIEAVMTSMLPKIKFKKFITANGLLID